MQGTRSEMLPVFQAVFMLEKLCCCSNLPQVDKPASRIFSCVTYDFITRIIRNRKNSRNAAPIAPMI